MISKYKFGDIMNSVFDDMGVDLWNPTSTSYTYKGQWVDTDKFEIVPKKSWYDGQIKKIEQELATLERQQESTLKYYENQRKVLQERKEKIEREKENKSG